MKLDLVFENSQILVINKPSGLVVNRSQTVNEETLQDLVSQYLNLPTGNLGIGDRAGIVHRLDRETSGIIIVAKSQKAFENLQKQFRSREVVKQYIALVHGRIEDEKIIISNKIKRIGKFGKFGVANFREEGKESESLVIKDSILQIKKEKFENLLNKGSFNKARRRYLVKNASLYSMVSVFPKTGRTHQIRVHLKSIGHPVVSDLIYDPNKLLKFDLLWCPRFFLHAQKIKFRDPLSKKTVEFTADLPEDLNLAFTNLTIDG